MQVIIDILAIFGFLCLLIICAFGGYFLAFSRKLDTEKKQRQITELRKYRRKRG